MCIIYNTIGSLVDIQTQLVINDIDEFNSLHELLDFEKQYQSIEHKLISEHNQLIANEKLELSKNIESIEESFSQKRNNVTFEAIQKINLLYDKIDNMPDPKFKVIPIVNDYLTHFIIWIKIWTIQARLTLHTSTLNLKSKKLIYDKKKRFDFIDLNFDEAVRQTSLKPLLQLQRKKILITGIRNSIYGAFGEQEVVNVLKTLTDEFILINNFVCSFRPSLYNSRQNNYISSVQIDHILIAPSGIFLIETKHWSKQSLTNESLRSPIEQIRSANFALYIIITNAQLQLNRHFWGKKKLPIKNLIVFTRAKPPEEFEFVKILNVNQLLSYVKYFSPIFNSTEIENIAEYLLSVSESKQIISRLHV